MKLLRNTLLAILLLSIAPTLADGQLLEWREQELSTLDAGDPLEYERFYAKYYGWQMACELTLYLCSEHQMPRVEFPVTRAGLYGYYEGGNTVYVSSVLRGTQLQATMIHEMIHYLHVQEDIIEVPGYAKEICWSENQAFTLTDIWYDWIGKPELKRGDWWGPYTHCWPYYRPDFNFWEWVEQMIIDGEITWELPTLYQVSGK